PPEDGPGSPDARRLPGRPGEGRGPAGGAPRQHRDPPESHAGGVQHGGARTLRAGDPVVHALHLADPALSRSDGAPAPRRRVPGRRPRPPRPPGHRRGVVAARAHRDGRGARDRAAEEGPAHAGQDRRDLRRLGERRGAVRRLRRAPRRVRRGPRARERPRRRLLRAGRGAAPAPRAADAPDVSGGGSRARNGNGRVDRAPAGGVRARGWGDEAEAMASKTAILIGGILLLLAATGRGAETDPVRRSLVVEAVERASPAVVNVSTEEVVEQRGSPFPFPQDPLFDEFFRDFRDPRPRRYTRESLGSGVIVAADGTILTNLHVILRASRIHVTLADEREFDATLVGADADSDLAVLRVKAGGALPYIALGSSKDLMIGETV